MRRKVVSALAISGFVYALSDVLLWQRIFERHDLAQFDAQYQSGHVVTLVGLIAVGVVLLWDVKLYALWYSGALYSLAFGGTADVLYYWIDHRAVPATTPWLNGNPFILFKPAGGWGLVASAAIWVVAWLALLWVAPIVRPHVANLWTIAPRRERFLTLLAALVVVVAFVSRLSPLLPAVYPQNPDAVATAVRGANMIPIGTMCACMDTRFSQPASPARTSERVNAHVFGGGVNS